MLNGGKNVLKSENWFNSNRMKKNINKKPLIIKGARQIEKTKSIKILLQKIIKMSWK